MLSWTRYPTTRPALPAAPPAPKAAPAPAVRYTGIDPDDDGPGPVVRLVAQAAAMTAAKELGIPVPRVRWFRRWTPQLDAYRKAYLPTLAAKFKTWDDAPGLLGRMLDTRPDEIWLSVDQDAASAARTARHEVAHCGQALAGLPLDEDIAESFCLGGREDAA